MTEPILIYPEEIPVEREIEVDSAYVQLVQENVKGEKTMGEKTMERDIKSESTATCSVNNSTDSINEHEEETR